MVKVYAVVLAAGFIGLLAIVIGGALAENMGRPERDPSKTLGHRGRLAVGASLGFGMGGMSAEFSPMDFSWPVALFFAVLGAAISMIWVRYMVPIDR